MERKDTEQRAVADVAPDGSTLVVVFLLSFGLPGLGHFYAGERLRWCLPWFLVANGLWMVQRWRYPWLSTVAVGWALAAAIHSRVVLRRLDWTLRAKRRYPSLSFAIPGLGQMRSFGFWYGIGWLVAFIGASGAIVAIAATQFVGSQVPVPPATRSAAYGVIPLAIALLAALDAWRLVRRRCRHEP